MGAHRVRCSKFGKFSCSGCTRQDLSPFCVLTQQPISTPSSAATGQQQGLGSRFHVPRHSDVWRISWVSQHRSLSARKVLHLELELKRLNLDGNRSNYPIPIPLQVEIPSFLSNPQELNFSQEVIS
jgi:hypothetical protein